MSSSGGSLRCRRFTRRVGVIGGRQTGLMAGVGCGRWRCRRLTGELRLLLQTAQIARHAGNRVGHVAGLLERELRVFRGAAQGERVLERVARRRSACPSSTRLHDRSIIASDAAIWFSVRKAWLIRDSISARLRPPGATS